MQLLCSPYLTEEDAEAIREIMEEIDKLVRAHYGIGAGNEAAETGEEK